MICRFQDMFRTSFKFIRFQGSFYEEFFAPLAEPRHLTVHVFHQSDGHLAIGMQFPVQLCWLFNLLFPQILKLGNNLFQQSVVVGLTQSFSQ